VAVDRLVGDAAFRDRLGDAGRRYTARYYRWPSIIDRYTEFLAGVVDRGQRAGVRSHRLAQPAQGQEYVRQS
jgi:hypothetical protein